MNAETAANPDDAEGERCAWAQGSANEGTAVNVLLESYCSGSREEIPNRGAGRRRRPRRGRRRRRAGAGPDRRPRVSEASSRLRGRRARSSGPRRSSGAMSDISQASLP